MLDILNRSNVNVGSATWEYHGDTDKPDLFYITPQPAWVMDNAQQLPRIQLVTYKTSTILNGSGYCTMQVKLDVPTDVIAEVTRQLQNDPHHPVQNPQFLSLPFQPGTLVSLTYPDGQGGTTGQQVNASDFGTNNAIFQLPLDPDQMKTLQAALGAKGGSPFELQYSIVVPAIMPSLTLDLTFDSSIALHYQVTSHEHTHWASSSSYTYDISKQLTSSGAGTIVLTKVDPNIPKEDVDRVRDWGQGVLENLVAQEVAAALALQNSASGTDSFDVSQISSFTENYTERQTIMWRLQPQTVLPSFADLGLTEQQIASLEVTVDKRQFVTQVTPACNFVGSAKSLNPAIAPAEGQYMGTAQRVKSLQVTIKYPTLNDKPDRTHTFTDNVPYTWQADWDDTAQGVYSLEYDAIYEDPAQPTVKGEVVGIETSAYTITLQMLGILNVTFDATSFFADKTVDSEVEKLNVNFIFNMPQTQEAPESFYLDEANMTQEVQSRTGAPISTDYLYTVTYIFKDGQYPPFTSDVKRGRGARVVIAAPDMTQTVGVVVDMTDVRRAMVNVYYKDTPYFPAIPASDSLPRPTSQSPIQLNFKPAPTKVGERQPRYQVQYLSLPKPGKAADDDPTTEQDFPVFANSQLTPLLIHASLLTKKGKQYDFGQKLFNPQSSTFFYLSATSSFDMLSADPELVDWTNLRTVTVRILAARYLDPTSAQARRSVALEGGATGTPTTYDMDLGYLDIGLDPQRNIAYTVFFPLTSLPIGYKDIEFDWEATYAYKGSDARVVSGTQKGTKLTLPVRVDKPAPTPPERVSLLWQPGGLLQLN